MQPENPPDTVLKDWLAASASGFDVLVGDAGRFPADAVFVDRAFLDREFEHAFPGRLGAFRLEATDKILQAVALRYAHRLARDAAPQIGVSADGLKHAWFHPLYAELMTFVPVRHLARKLVDANKDATFVVDIAKTSFAAINYWRLNEVEPIYLAYELRRQGARVCIRVDRLDHPVLKFELSGAWRRKWHSQFKRDRTFASALCEKHMRRDEFVSQQLGITHRFRPSIVTFLKSRRVGRGRDPLTVALVEGPAINGMRAYSAPATLPDLLNAFVQLISPATLFLRDWFRRELRSKDVQVAHVADHASLEGGLLAAEVVGRGGKVHLWPHSANVVDVAIHQPENVAAVTLAARSTAAVWAEKFGPDKVSVDVRTILPSTSKTPAFDEAHPIHVVLFAGAHVLQRTPFFSLETHKATWRTVLSDLSSSSVELTVKHKSQWETRDWIGQLADKGSDIRFTRTHANKLSLPNMVFMSISLTSTAIFEGIARGIPGIVVRDVPVRETPYYDPRFVPCLSSDAVAGFLSELNNKRAWEALRAQQLDWFARETSW